MGVLGLGPTSGPLGPGKGFSSEGSRTRITPDGAAHGDRLSPPPPRSLPADPPRAGACPQDQAVHGSGVTKVTFTRAGGSKTEGRPPGGPSHLLLDLGDRTRWGGEGRPAGQGVTAGYGLSAGSSRVRRGNEGAAQTSPAPPRRTQHFCFPLPLPVPLRGRCSCQPTADSPWGSWTQPPAPAEGRGTLGTLQDQAVASLPLPCGGGTLQMAALSP